MLTVPRFWNLELGISALPMEHEMDIVAFETHDNLL
jgi:hypothetical protein